jgi:hypothetical protein
MTDAAGEYDAAREYKDVIGELNAAAEAMRVRDHDRAEALRSELVDLDAAMTTAADRAARSHQAVEQHWEAVVEALWNEQWMTLRLPPRPDPDADPEQLDALDMAADRAAMEVLDAAARPRFPFGLG